MAGFERCVGCPSIMPGQKCATLARVLAEEVDVNNPDFRRVEFKCPDLGPGASEICSITRDEARYGGIVAPFADTIFKAWFGGN